MGATSIIYFIFTLWGLGFLLLKFSKAKESADFIERNIIRTAFGLSLLIMLAMILNLVKVPLDWRVFLALAVIGPIIYVVNEIRLKRIPQFKISFKTSYIGCIIAIALFIFSLMMYSKGAFVYPYLENDDPWSHASGVSYIAHEKTIEASNYRPFQYMNPYPPAYDFVLGLVHQLEPSLMWTMKFYNALIISLGILYFYFFAKAFMGSQFKAAFATVIIAFVPAYLSHFIWAPAIAMTLFYPAIYGMVNLKNRFVIASSVAISALLVAHPTHSIILGGLVAIYAIVKTFESRKIQHLAALTLGGILSLTWWAFDGKKYFFDIQPGLGVGEAIVQHTNIFTKFFGALGRFFHPHSGTATRAYNFNDFFIANPQNLINNPIGFGTVALYILLLGLAVAPIFLIKKISLMAKLGILAITGIILAYFMLLRQESMLTLILVYSVVMIILIIVSREWKQGNSLFISLIWFILTFLIVNSITFNLPYGIFGFRAWMILAIPWAIIATEGAWIIVNTLNIFKGSKIIEIAGKTVIIVLLVAGLWFTSGVQKYTVNTANWPPGAFWTSIDEIRGYAWLSSLPVGTKVWNYRTDDQLLGFDKFSCGWCEAEANYRKTGFNDSAADTATWMRSHGYKYIILGGLEVQMFGEEAAVKKIQALAESPEFAPAFYTPPEGPRVFVFGLK